MDNPFKYGNYYADSESGMNYCAARYYSPELMTWISRDSWDVTNRYGYCSANPVSMIDPGGHDADDISEYACFGLIGFCLILVVVAIPAVIYQKKHISISNVLDNIDPTVLTEPHHSEEFQQSNGEAPPTAVSEPIKEACKQLLQDRGRGCHRDIPIIQPLKTDEASLSGTPCYRTGDSPVRPMLHLSRGHSLMHPI